MTDINFPMKGRKGMVDWARNSEDKVVIPKGLFISQSAGTWLNGPRKHTHTHTHGTESVRVPQVPRVSPRDITCFVLCHPSFGGRRARLWVFEQNLRSCQPLLGFVSTRRFRAALRPPPFDRVLYITHRCQTIWLIVVISLSVNKSKSTNPGAEEESLATPIWKQKKLMPPDTSGHLLQSAEIYPAALVSHLCQPETGSLMLEELFTFCFQTWKARLSSFWEPFSTRLSDSCCHHQSKCGRKSFSLFV